MPYPPGGTPRHGERISERDALRDSEQMSSSTMMNGAEHLAGEPGPDGATRKRTMREPGPGGHALRGASPTRPRERRRDHVRLRRARLDPDLGAGARRSPSPQGPASRDAAAPADCSKAADVAIGDLVEGVLARATLLLQTLPMSSATSSRECEQLERCREHAVSRSSTGTFRATASGSSRTSRRRRRRAAAPARGTEPTPAFAHRRRAEPDAHVGGDISGQSRRSSTYSSRTMPGVVEPEARSRPPGRTGETAPTRTSALEGCARAHARTPRAAEGCACWRSRSRRRRSRASVDPARVEVGIGKAGRGMSQAARGSPPARACSLTCREWTTRPQARSNTLPRGEVLGPGLPERRHALSTTPMPEQPRQRSPSCSSAARYSRVVLRPA